jgi:hypothetical protein
MFILLKGFFIVYIVLDDYISNILFITNKYDVYVKL